MLCLNMRMVKFLKKSALLTEQKAEQGPNLNSVLFVKSFHREYLRYFF